MLAKLLVQTTAPLMVFGADSDRSSGAAADPKPKPAPMKANELTSIQFVFEKAIPTNPPKTKTSDTSKTFFLPRRFKSKDAMPAPIMGDKCNVHSSKVSSYFLAKSIKTSLKTPIKKKFISHFFSFTKKRRGWDLYVREDL